MKHNNNNNNTRKTAILTYLLFEQCYNLYIYLGFTSL